MPIDGTNHPRLRIVVTRMLPPSVMQLFERRHQVWGNPHDRTLTQDELQQAASDADALVVTAFDRLDAGANPQPTGLRIVATYSVGIEHLDLDAARRRGLAVLSTPDVLSEAVAEMAILLMLGAARRAHRGTQPPLQSDLEGLDADAAGRHRDNRPPHGYPWDGAHRPHDRSPSARLRHDGALSQPPAP